MPRQLESAAKPPSQTDTAEAGGEVTVASNEIVDTMPTVRWLSDASLLSLLSIMNARQIAAAEIELENWHMPVVRDFALAMLRDHTSLQRTIDSASTKLNLVPVRPALADQVAYLFQTQIDSMWARGRGARGNLDRAFVAQQITSHELMSSYVRQLAGAAESAELQNFLSTVNTRVLGQLSQARSMRGRLVTGDSSGTAGLPQDSTRRAFPSVDSLLRDSRLRDTSARSDSGRSGPRRPDSERPDSAARRVKPDSL